MEVAVESRKLVFKEE